MATASFAVAVGGAREKFVWNEYVEVDTTFYHIPHTMQNEETVVYAINQKYFRGGRR